MHPATAGAAQSCLWSYDFVEDRTHDGRRYRNAQRARRVLRVARKLKAIDVIDVLSDLFILRGIPAHIRSDNGPEFVAKAVQEWIAVAGAKTAYIERGSPWENGYIESFNARLRDELLNGEIFSLREAQIVIESWRRHYNTIRPHASIGYKPPAPEVFVPAFTAWPAEPVGEGVEALDVAVLPRTAPLDIGSLGADSGNPSLDGLGNEFRSIIRPDMTGDAS